MASIAQIQLTSVKDVAQVIAHVLCGKGKHGFSDKHRGQLMVLTGMSHLPSRTLVYRS